MKKSILALILLGTLLVISGCTAVEPDAEVQWSVMIVAENDELVEFTDVDAQSMTAVVVETTRTDREGNILEQTWTGVPLKDVLVAKELAGYTGCLVEASDGYSKEYSLEIMEGDETIIAWLLDGEVMDEEAGGPVQMIPKGEANNMYIRNLVKIILQFE